MLLRGMNMVKTQKISMLDLFELVDEDLSVEGMKKSIRSKKSE